MSLIMDNHHTIIEKFTGKLHECASRGHFEFTNLPMGSYDFFYIVTEDRCFAGEVCLFKTRSVLYDPMSRSSEASPIVGAEDGSGKIIDSCFSLYSQPNNFIFFDGDFNYCLYKLIP